MNSAVRAFVFLVVFALFWVTPTPFVDLRDPNVLLAQETGNTFEQLCTVSVLLLAMAVLAQKRTVARLALSPGLVATLGWQAVDIVMSTRPDLSFRRAVLNGFILAISLAWLLVPASTRQFRRLLAFACFAVLGLAYFGVVFMPEVSIHNLQEVLELSNAGAWRGQFVHKNVAGAAMVVLIAYGLYLGATLNRALGTALIVLAGVFLWFSDNKTSIGLILVALLLTWAIERARTLRLRAVLALVPIGLMMLFTVGSVMIKPVGALVAAVSSDPTFTDRTTIWRFALDRLSGKLLFGYGFQAFWGTSALVNGGYGLETWAAGAGHAHDAYLNTAMEMGLPGMLIVMVWLGWEPLRNFHTAGMTGNDPQISRAYLRIWMFTMLYACLESPFFSGLGPLWFSLLVAVFGLRLQAKARTVERVRVVPGHAAPQVFPHPSPLAEPL